LTFNLSPWIFFSDFPLGWSFSDFDLFTIGFLRLLAKAPLRYPFVDAVVTGIFDLLEHHPRPLTDLEHSTII
jgi:hypothetical protein